MGAGLSKVKAERPQQFYVSSHSDFNAQLDRVLKAQPTIIKTVVLPPGVALDDPRLAMARVIEENRYTLEPGAKGIWPDDAPFEVDVAPALVPPVHGRPAAAAHYTVYPDARFADDVRCGVCDSAARS